LALSYWADDQGREVKAVLWYGRRYCTGATTGGWGGSGERILLRSSTLNRSGEWAGLIWTELFVMDVPSSDDSVVIEPFLEIAPMSIYDAAERIGTVIILAVWRAFCCTFSAVQAVVGAINCDAIADVSGRGVNATKKPA
jgi:hypothetical protein